MLGDTTEIRLTRRAMWGLRRRGCVQTDRQIIDHFDFIVNPLRNLQVRRMPCDADPATRIEEAPLSRSTSKRNAARHRSPLMSGLVSSAGGSSSGSISTLKRAISSTILGIW
jgi:hypothetical protein